MGKCSIKGLAISLGITWGLSMLLLGWIAATGWGAGWVNGLSSLYVGFKPGFLGGIIGGVWGFIDGAIGGVLIAYFYNLFAEKK
jgi:hypothetical protein